MNKQQSIVDEIHRILIERYPLYQSNGGFEQWLLRKADMDESKIHTYLDLLDSYGYMNGDGTLAGDYANMPDPERVHDDINARLSKLSPGALDALHRASIEGEHFCVETVIALADGEESRAGDMLREAERNGVIVRDGSESLYSEGCERYRFLPLQTREIIYQQIPEEERNSMHTAFVEFLSGKVDGVEDDGKREMLNHMISEHNKRVARPEPLPEKQH
jgi:hypothetical protein